MGKKHRNRSQKQRNKSQVIEPSQRKLRIGWLWHTPDQWMLHRTTKDGLWEVLSHDDFTFKDLLKSLFVKEEWLEIRPEDKIAPNYPLLLFIWKEYCKHYKKFGPSIMWKLSIKKLGTFILTLYREDSAYIDRIGGAITHIYENKHLWTDRSVSARVAALTELRDWWYREDWRTRGKDKLLRLFNKVIELYQKDVFIRNSIDYIIQMLMINESRWFNIPERYNPEKWYPRGKGQINYIVHGRRA